ncbi:MAG: hypothetical protein OEQ18_03565 [Gammaproteobacteria bacterium]|nr:hypothetical protein [Gammaproteobacteria bacterium]
MTTESPPHLQVAFNLGTLENVSVANGGASQNMRIDWWAHSSVATWESDWHPSSYIPNPGSVIHFDAPFYVGEVANGCGNVAVFPIEFSSEVSVGMETLGDFSATDNSTIQPNGYWNFTYAIRVSDNAGGTSDIRVKGIVSALCVW